MKLPLLAVLYCGLSSIGSAFTMDFSGVSIGASLPQTVNVPGYGSVTFQSLQGAVTPPGHLTIQPFAPFNQNAIEFNVGESILMTFMGSTPSNVQNQYAGVGADEAFKMTAGANANQYIVSFSGPSGSTAGLQSVDFSVRSKSVPEPSSALLGLMACCACLVRRSK